MTGSGSLAELQEQFIAHMLDETAPVPSGWGASQGDGMQVYRGNYRSALVDAMRDTYEHTQKWVGIEAFRKAAVHHLIARPPAGWTIDEAGSNFSQTCEELFAGAPEVAELAWLEWSMLVASRSADCEPVTTEHFAQATSQFAESDWFDLRLAFVPGLVAAPVSSDLRALWRALSNGASERPEPRLEHPQGCLVWREGERPTFLMADAEEAEMLAAMQSGQSYGEICARLAGNGDDTAAFEQAAMRGGAMLGRWIGEGLVVALR